MKYALNLPEDGRILSVTDAQYAAADAPVVDMLPPGSSCDYLYTANGEYVYAPEHPFFPTAPRNIIEGEYVTVGGTLYKATENIPNGESIIAGQNAIATSIEEQLAELTKGV